jgi:hypothetical protein
MTIFKSKNTKKILLTNNNIVTLDNKHNELLNIFDKEELIIPKLKEEKMELKRKLQEEKLKKENLSNDYCIDKLLELNEKIKYIDNEIKIIKNKRKNYLLDNSKYIFEYFENKKQVEDGKNKIKKLDSFFNVKSNNENSVNELLNSNVQNYLNNIDDSFFDINNYILAKDVCQYCHNGELVPIEHEGIMVCKNCSRNVKYLVENEKPSYKEPPKEVCFYAYKRINHFREILAQFQAKETTQINPEVIEDIKLQIKKERINLKQITNKKMKEILKKLGYNKYYEHIPFIKDKLGIKPPVMSPELEETLCNLFMDIQGPYAKYCPNDRVNFLNYYYTIYKLCELLGQDSFLPYFQLLKDKEKMIEQDEIWKKICEELDWEFIPSI